VFVIVQVRCWPSAMVPKQSPLASTIKIGPPELNTSPNPTKNCSPGCSVTTTPFPIADWHGKVCCLKNITQTSGREQLGSVGSGVVVDVGVTATAQLYLYTPQYFLESNNPY
jgi:hypothetical protein